MLQRKEYFNTLTTEEMFLEDSLGKVESATMKKITSDTVLSASSKREIVIPPLNTKPESFLSPKKKIFIARRVFLPEESNQKKTDMRQSQQNAASQEVELITKKSFEGQKNFQLLEETKKAVSYMDNIQSPESAEGEKSEENSKIFTAKVSNSPKINPKKGKEQQNILEQSFDSQYSNHNIFDQNNIQSSFQLKNTNGTVGPTFDESGKIVTRSMVGRPEWFMNNQNGKLSKEDLNIFNSKKSKVQMNSSMSGFSKNAKSVKSFSKPTHSKLSKFQLEVQLQQVQNRIDKNRNYEQQVIDQLQTADKIRFTQQERNLKKYDSIEQKWVNFIDQSSNLLNRDVSSSILVKSDSYRQRREMTDVFETAKGPYEMFGTRVWYMNLREEKESANNVDPDCEKQKYNTNPLVVLEDMPLAFQRSLPKGVIKRQMEIVRKPTLTNLNNSLKQLQTSRSSKLDSSLQSLQSPRPFNTFDSFEYYTNRLKDIREDFKFNKKTLIDQQQMEIEKLSVIGVSQYQREEEMLLNSKQEYFDSKSDSVEQYCNEMIEINYNSRGAQSEGGLRNLFLPPISSNSTQIQKNRSLNSFKKKNGFEAMQ